jgi:hypothetical protein
MSTEDILIEEFRVLQRAVIAASPRNGEIVSSDQMVKLHGLRMKMNAANDRLKTFQTKPLT